MKAVCSFPLVCFTPRQFQWRAPVRRGRCDSELSGCVDVIGMDDSCLDVVAVDMKVWGGVQVRSGQIRVGQMRYG
ncbi:hypothetical protein F2Q69_00012741 [Brassica cretica]|uniref:Uncharacterized protein n=1 Tax=Brassica cretica TaxID=69181 RepID=A0A8S9QME8_BRACR|nr:hypothetical protein F2Q69_00012741 [Brassica cretica]